MNIPGDVTIEAWVNPAVNLQKGYAGIFVGRGPGTGTGSADYAMAVAGDAGGSRIRFNYCNLLPNCSNWFDTASWAGGSSGAVTAGTWAQIVVTRNIADNKVRFYKNGALLEVFSGIGAGLGQLANSKVIGADVHQGSNGYFNGAIDEVAIWNRALSDIEIQTLYNNSQ
ncbi:Concanavalin A-like lectin/glucanases superfamily protein [uncultured archaeon]|nr:Concanavalin A-like lectin/glucanases superfamily protein [uncultured archaeon]